MFKYYKLLPDEEAKQSPKLLFEVIGGLNEDEETDIEIENVPEKFKAFYGM